MGHLVDQKLVDEEQREQDDEKINPELVKFVHVGCCCDWCSGWRIVVRDSGRKRENQANGRIGNERCDVLTGLADDRRRTAVGLVS